LNAAGAEVGAGATQHHARGPGQHVLDQARELDRHGIVRAIAALGAVERDLQDRTVLL